MHYDYKDTKSSLKERKHWKLYSELTFCDFTFFFFLVCVLPKWTHVISFSNQGKSLAQCTSGRVTLALPRKELSTCSLGQLHHSHLWSFLNRTPSLSPSCPSQPRRQSSLAWRPSVGPRHSQWQVCVLASENHCLGWKTYHSYVYAQSFPLTFSCFLCLSICFPTIYRSWKQNKLRTLSIRCLGD